MSTIRNGHRSIKKHLFNLDKSNFDRKSTKRHSTHPILLHLSHLVALICVEFC